MQSYIYGLGLLVSIFISTTAATVSKSNEVTPTSQDQIIHKNERLKLGIKILKELDTTFDNLVKLKPERSTKLEDRSEVATEIRRLISKKTKINGQNYENDLDKRNQKDVDRISASDLVQTILSAISRQKRSAKPSDNTDKENDLTENLTSKSIDKTDTLNEKDNLSTKRVLTIDKTHDKTDISANHRSKRFAEPRHQINSEIDKLYHGRDLVLEAVKQLIEGEKTRRRFDMVNPPNSQYTKRQQLLWDRLRMKAAEELLLHPKPLPERVTERIFDSFKKDWEILRTTGPTVEPGLFNDFKRRIEKQYYLDEYGTRQRDFISTLKPRVYLQ